MKKTLRLSLAAVGVAGLISGGTFAGWNDTDSLIDNTTTAGHLDLVLGGSTALSNDTGPSIAPGEFRSQAVVLNSADLDGVPNADLSLVIDGLEDYENDCTDPEVDDSDSTCDNADITHGEFSDQSFFRIRWSDPGAGYVVEGGTCKDGPGGAAVPITNGDTSPPVGTWDKETNSDSLADVVAATAGAPIALGNLLGSESVCVLFDVGLPFGVPDNKAMSDSSVFDLNFTLTQ